MIINDNGVIRDMTSEEIAQYEATMASIPKIPYKDRVVARIRERYSVDDEFELINEKDEKPERYKEYRNFVEQIKIEEKGVK